MPDSYYKFVLGLLVMACITSGMFFLRFWRKTTDRLFLIFAVAFFLLGLNWLLLACMRGDEDQIALLYIIRLISFLLILGAIFDKNRAHKTRL